MTIHNILSAAEREFREWLFSAQCHGTEEATYLQLDCIAGQAAEIFRRHLSEAAKEQTTKTLLNDLSESERQSDLEQPAGPSQPTVAEQKTYDLPTGDDFWIRRDGDWRIVTFELSHSCRDAFSGCKGCDRVAGLLSELPRGGWQPASAGLSGEQRQRLIKERDEYKANWLGEAGATNLIQHLKARAEQAEQRVKELEANQATVVELYRRERPEEYESAQVMELREQLTASQTENDRLKRLCKTSADELHRKSIRLSELESGLAEKQAYSQLTALADEALRLREQFAAADKLIAEWRSHERMPVPYHDAGATYGHCADALEAALAAGGPNG